MLKDCIEIFNSKLQKYKEQGDGFDETTFITDACILDQGTYLLLDNTGKIVEKLETKKGERQDSELYAKFAKLDYYSRYLNSNKAIADKNISSNNFLSLFVKKENIDSKLNLEMFEKYYQTLKNPLESKYKSKKKSKELYVSYEEENGKVDVEKLEKMQKIITGLFFEEGKNTEIKELPKDKNSYLKIFFDEDETLYQQEGNRYFVPNIYNSTDYNETIDGQIYGLPDNNSGLNAKKPYLENKGRKNSIPIFLSIEEALLQKKFFDYLLNLANEKKYHIYFSENGIQALSNGEVLKGSDFKSGCFIRIQKGTEIEIQDFDIISDFKTDIKIKVDDFLNIDYGNYLQNLQYEAISNISQLQAVVHEIFYSKWLCGNYYTQAKDIRLNGKLKDILINSRSAWIDLFYKGRRNLLEQTFAKFSLEIVKNSILNGNTMRAREQFNLRASICNHLYKGEKMQTLNEIAEGLFKKIEADQTPQIASDKEFYFAAGQLANYFISLNKSSNKTQALINPIINAKNKDKLLLELQKMYKKYNYAIKNNSTRFKNLYAMVLGCGVEGEIDTSALLAGYLYSSLIYRKNNKENDNE